MSDLGQLLERLLGALVVVDPNDPATVGPASTLAREALAACDKSTRTHVVRFIETLEFADFPLTGETFAALSTAIGDAQKALARQRPVAPKIVVAPPPTIEARAPAPPSPQPVVPVERDAETVALFAEFVGEAEEGLATCDEILLRAEQGEIVEDDVHALFRAYHTIKGVAGFLELGEIQSLAHETETLLGLARDGSLVISPDVVAVLLDATRVTRELIEAVANAVKTGLSIRSHRGLHEMIERLEAARNGRPVAHTPAHSMDVGPAAPAPAPEPRVVALHGPIAVAPAEARVAAPAPRVTHAARPDDGGSVEGEGGGASGDAAALRQTVKIDVERIDAVVEMIGELVIVESMLTHSPDLSGTRTSNKVKSSLAQLAKISRDLQTVAMRMRMVPVRTAFQKMPRLAREVSRSVKKDVQLVVTGESTEMDRSMVERLGDPLVHMLRNSIDHGLETPEERVKAGKPTKGTVRLSAYHEGSSVVIEVGDDGRGLNRKAILDKAIRQGLVSASDTLTDDEINHLIFAPGFSTAAQVTDLSGRGVGMDVVKKTIESMRGRVQIKSEQGQGTTFRIVLPLTLAIVDATIVGVGAERYILPSLSIVESLKPSAAMLGTMGGHRELVRFRGRVLPMFRAARLFGVPGAEEDLVKGMIVVVEAMGRLVALAVDSVLGQQQVVIKSLDGTLAHSASFVGAAIVSDGHVALIINTDDLGRLGEVTQLAAHGRTQVAA